MPRVLPERDETGKGGDDGPGSADVHTKQQLPPVVREVGKQDRRGNVADALAGQCGNDQGRGGQKAAEKALYRRDPRQISGEDKKADKGTQKRIIHDEEGAKKEKEQGNGDNKESEQEGKRTETAGT